MKIFTARQLYDADKYTIEQQGISSAQLMERAAEALFAWLHKRLNGAPVKIHLFCGIGNNGGDGVALARHLWEHGYDIRVYVVNYSDKRSPDFLSNLERLKERKIWPEFLNEKSALPELKETDFIVDAIFGIGLNRPPAEWVCKLIEHLNKSGAFILSVDIPSGLFADSAVTHEKGIVKADFILAIQAPKLVFYLPETAEYAPDWDVVDIGMDKEFLQALEADFIAYNKLDVLAFYKPRKKFAHKGQLGHSLIIGGSFGKIGAVVLAAGACFRGGSGLVTALVPGCGYLPLQTGLPEAMVITDPEEKLLTRFEYDIEPSAIGIGIGMGTAEATLKGFSDFMASNTLRLVIDADGINALSKTPALFKYLKKSILTPHPGELEGLIGKWENDFDKLSRAFKFVEEYQCILVIKGAHTIIIAGGKGYINSTGNPGMATAGSGDVLTGLLTALLAQGYQELQAAMLGVFLHGLAGDLMAREVGFEALTASGIVNTLGKAYLELLRPPEHIPAEPEVSEEE